LRPIFEGFDEKVQLNPQNTTTFENSEPFGQFEQKLCSFGGN
jgi:hypothetical protein